MNQKKKKIITTVEGKINPKKQLMKKIIVKN